jgi:hypothetical protein
MLPPPYALCLIAVFSLASFATSNDIPRHAGGIHIPLHHRHVQSIKRRGRSTGAIGLGDFVDVYVHLAAATTHLPAYPPLHCRTYNLLVTVGTTTAPVVLGEPSPDVQILRTRVAHFRVIRHGIFRPLGALRRLRQLFLPRRTALPAGTPAVFRAKHQPAVWRLTHGNSCQRCDRQRCGGGGRHESFQPVLCRDFGHE